MLENYRFGKMIALKALPKWFKIYLVSKSGHHPQFKKGELYETTATQIFHSYTKWCLLYFQAFLPIDYRFRTVHTEAEFAPGKHAWGAFGAFSNASYDRVYFPLDIDCDMRWSAIFQGVLIFCAICQMNFHILMNIHRFFVYFFVKGFCGNFLFSTSYFRQMWKFRHDFWSFPRVWCVEKWINLMVFCEFFTLSTEFSTPFLKNRVDLSTHYQSTSVKNDFVAFAQK